MSAADLREAEEAKKRLEALKGLRRGEKVTSLDDIKYSEVSDSTRMMRWQVSRRRRRKKKKKKKTKKMMRKSLVEELEETMADKDNAESKKKKKELPSDRAKRKSVEKQRSYVGFGTCPRAECCCVSSGAW